MSDVHPVIERLVLGSFQTNCYLVLCPDTHAALIIDPADDPDRILRTAELKEARIEQILLTHAHPDHIAGLPALRQSTGATVLAHRLEAQTLGLYLRFFGLPAEQLPLLRPNVQLDGGEEIAVGRLRGTVIHTPGHSPGSITLKMGSHLFTGDTLFARGVGRVDLPGGNLESLVESLGLILTQPDESIVYPGHGPSSTVGKERRQNPYV